ncbi:MAG: hypothetical protein ACR2J3_10665, partial [Aridibacter sp.]
PTAKPKRLISDAEFKEYIFTDAKRQNLKTQFYLSKRRFYWNDWTDFVDKWIYYSREQPRKNIFNRNKESKRNRA